MPLRPLNIRVTGGAPPTPPAGNVLSPSKISYLGCLRMPVGVDTTFAYGGMSGRIVSGQTHLFVYGNPVQSAPPDVYEIDVTGLTPDPTPASAPRATLINNWGDIYHGKRLAWDGATLSPLVGLTGINHGLYWHEGLQQLFWGYDYNYTNNALWTIGFSTLDNSGASTAYGPFRFRATTGDGQTRDGNRCQVLTAHPTTGKMIAAGIAKSGAAVLPWGPNNYGGNDFPTPSSPSGLSSLIAQTYRYLDYYFPSTITFDGNWTGNLKSFRYPQAITYPYEYFAASLTDNRIDPLKNSGRGTWSSVDGVTSLWWFEGVNQRGVVWTATLMGSAIAAPTDPNATHEYYNNDGQISMFLSGISGTFTQGEMLRGTTSHADMQIGAYDTGVGLSGAQAGTAFTVTETLTGTSSGAHGVVQTSTVIGGGYFQATLTSVVGTFTVGEAIRGTVTPAYLKVFSWTAGTATLIGVSFANFTSAETVTGLTSGATATIATLQRHDRCTHGFTLPVAVTGPGTTRSVPTLIIFDPAKLDAVKNGSATDWMQDADYVIDLEATYGIVTAPQTDSGGAKAIAGNFYDPNTKRLYLNAIRADVTTPGIATTLIHVFQIADTP